MLFALIMMTLLVGIFIGIASTVWLLVHLINKEPRNPYMEAVNRAKEAIDEKVEEIAEETEYSILQY